MVTQAVQELVEAFDRLPEEDRRTATVVILRRSLALSIPSLDDESLCEIADVCFQALDEEEARRGDAPTE